MLFYKKIVRSYRSIKNEVNFPFRDYHKKHNCVFIHVPKAAGTSVLAALGKKSSGRDHLPWYVYYSANPKYFEKAFKFAFVRNPWCRTVSAYNYLYNGGNEHSDEALTRQIQQYPTLDSFVLEGLGQGRYRNNLLFIPQSEFLINGEGEVAVDYVGRYETLVEDFSVIANRLNIKKNLLMSNQSKIGGGSYRQYFKSDDAIKTVENLYLQDITVFGYSY